MALPQELQPNERGIALYEDGVFQGYEDIVTISDEELEEEQERKAMENAEGMIDAISNLAEAKDFLRKLCKRLFKNGALP